LFHSAGVREVVGNLLVLQRLEMETKRLTAADKETITTLRAKIPEPILAHYDRMRARGKLAVAIIRNKVCTGCHMTVPIGVMAVLLRGDDIQLCGNCGRYLYLPSEPEPAPAAAKPAEPKRKATPIKRRKKAEPMAAAPTSPTPEA
jgi:hypothetical protein